MTHLTPSPAGYDHTDELLLQITEALGYDLEKIENNEDPGGKCPCCQIDAVMDLLLADRAAMYRKGWKHIVDGSTPACPDLLFSSEILPEDLDAAMNASVPRKAKSQSIDTITPA